MNKEQYAEMLKDISETNKIGGSVSDCIEHLTFVDPSLPDAFAKSITSDIVGSKCSMSMTTLSRAAWVTTPRST